MSEGTLTIPRKFTGSPVATISTGTPDDECECGDYRAQHEGGVGKCLACRGGSRDWGDEEHGPCQRFVLYEPDADA